MIQAATSGGTQPRCTCGSSGHVGPDDDAGAEVVASGILRLGATAFIRQLATFRVEAPTFLGRTIALGRFGRLFMGRLWDVHARDVLAWSPV